jgi:aminoglycoside phosphotransferase (APT) family kinase protein
MRNSTTNPTRTRATTTPRDADQRLAYPACPPVPEPVVVGKATSVYPFTWAIYGWIDGEAYHDDLVHDERQAADDLARFVTKLRRADPVGAPPGGRRPLRELDGVTRMAIESSGDVIDSDAATAAWEDALRAPDWSGTGVWIHTDLRRPNLLVDQGRLCAVIDFGGVGVGDPAADVIAAWSVFNQTGRETYRNALEVDDDTWMRARGYALHQSALIIPYYAKSNPAFVSLAKRTVEEVLADIAA